MAMGVTIATAADCQYDYSPCSCYSYGIVCDQVPMADVATAFQSKPAMDIDQLFLYVRPEGDSIPADLLGQSRITDRLLLSGSGILRVDPNPCIPFLKELIFEFRGFVVFGYESIGFRFTHRLTQDFLYAFTISANF